MPDAYVFTANGGPEVEALIDWPRPVPGPCQVLVLVRATGVNPADVKRRRGLVAEAKAGFPVLFGREAAGIVAELGEGAAGFVVGDAVFGQPAAGSFAEYAVIHADQAALKPDALSFADAATLPVAAATAYDGIEQLGLSPGSTLLVTGIGGGVGVAAAQLARHRGLRVIGTASAGKKDLVTALGAVHVTYGPGVTDRIRAAAPDGVDAIFDLVGGEALAEIASLAGGRSTLISAAAGHLVTELGGSPVKRARSRAVLDAVARLAVDGVLDPHVTAVYPLREAGRALRAVEDGHTAGKIVLTVGPREVRPADPVKLPTFQIG
ncbi:MAG TPA: NADP-dependent oxidoreductase [Frankiaceae bacterium]|jgi:NADPH:quinone reductase-like Zn-dependent oxidoreductase|nr:NADP-dependent oxidoreductase [Frankiaceae bacterium]